MGNNVIALTVLEKDGVALPAPRIRYFPFDMLQDFDVDVNIGTKIQIAGERVRVAETPLEIEALANIASTDLFVVPVLAAGLTGNLAVQATGTAIAKTVVEFDTVTGTTEEAGTLDAATVGKVRHVINNDANVALLVFPAVGDFIGALAVNISYPVPFGTRVTFYCAVADNWIVVVDNGQ